MQHQMRVDELLARSVNVQWFEGVALVQSVCREIIATRGTSVGFPAPSSIVLGADGGVSIAGAAGGPGGASGAAHLLSQMVSDDVPVRLRLLLTQVTGSEGSSTTLADFSEALAYFERPDPAQILRILFERAMLAAVRPDLPAAVSPVQPPSPAAPEPQDDEPGHRRGVSGVAVLVAVLAAVLCAAVWLVGSGYGDGRLYATLSDLKSTLVGASETPPADVPVEATATTGKSKRRDGNATARRETPGSSGDVQRFSRTAAPRQPAPTALGLLTLPLLSPISRAERDLAAAIVGASTLDAGRPVFVDEEPLVVIASVGPSRGRELDGRVYSRGDARVTLPRSVYPKLPPDPTDPAELAKRSVLELLIAPDGLVERVRLRSTPRDVHEFMLVSAAKAWRFEPATFEGRPVRFLHRVAITLQ